MGAFAIDAEEREQVVKDRRGTISARFQEDPTYAAEFWAEVILVERSVTGNQGGRSSSRETGAAVLQKGFKSTVTVRNAGTADEGDAHFREVSGHICRKVRGSSGSGSMLVNESTKLMCCGIPCVALLHVDCDVPSQFPVGISVLDHIAELVGQTDAVVGIKEIRR